MRAVTLPDVTVLSWLEPDCPLPRVRPLELPPDPKMFTPPGLADPFCRRGALMSSNESSKANVSPAPWCSIIARMTLSLTPFFFRSISRSGARSKRDDRVRMIAITVFSLNPARTSLITAEFVSGGGWPSWACVAETQNSAAQMRTPRLQRRAIRDATAKLKSFNSLSSLAPARWSTGLRDTSPVTLTNSSHITLRLVIRGHSRAELRHASLARIVARQNHVHAAIVSL